MVILENKNRGALHAPRFCILFLNAFAARRKSSAIYFIPCDLMAFALDSTFEMVVWVVFFVAAVAVKVVVGTEKSITRHKMQQRSFFIIFTSFMKFYRQISLESIRPTDIYYV